jgi:hypothetical protein
MNSYQILLIYDYFTSLVSIRNLWYMPSEKKICSISDFLLLDGIASKCGPSSDSFICFSLGGDCFGLMYFGANWPRIPDI